MNKVAQSREDVYKELTDVFHEVFDNDQLVLADQLTAKDVEHWDSLSHINLIVAVEQRFQVKFTTAEVARMANVGELVDLIVSKLSHF